MVLLSGYAHPLYQEALAAWHCLTLNVRCSSAVRVPAESGEATRANWTRTECIWMNAACVQHQPSLFHAFDEDRQEILMNQSDHGERERNA
jgi:hypothetical protein